jgi:hypothetical protein
VFDWFSCWYNIVRKHDGMDHIRIIACQAKTINAYKIQLMKCCANIYFNKQSHSVLAFHMWCV